MIKVLVAYTVLDSNHEFLSQKCRLDISENLSDERRRFLISDLCETLSLLRGYEYDEVVDISYE